MSAVEVVAGARGENGFTDEQVLFLSDVFPTGYMGAEVVDYEETPDVVEILKEMTGGRGPDACIDADPSFVVTHRMSLEDAPTGYETFKHKREDCMKVVLTP